MKAKMSPRKLITHFGAAYSASNSFTRGSVSVALKSFIFLTFWSLIWPFNFLFIYFLRFCRVKFSSFYQMNEIIEKVKFKKDRKSWRNQESVTKTMIQTPILKISNPTKVENLHFLSFSVKTPVPHLRLKVQTLFMGAIKLYFIKYES